MESERFGMFPHIRMVENTSREMQMTYQSLHKISLTLIDEKGGSERFPLRSQIVTQTQIIITE